MRDIDKLMEGFRYNFFVCNRYTITDELIDGINYTGICNNGFIKMHTEKGKAYWLAQNELGHLTPDWKFHVSVSHKDLEKAWDIVTRILLENKLRSGAKCAYLKELSGIKPGREITIYIFKYTSDYSNSQIAQDYELNFDEEHSSSYWAGIVQKIETSLEENKVSSNGCAKGDYKIGKFVSLRNEAYVYDRRLDIDEYPSDEAGWNPKGHEIPFDLKLFSKFNKSSNSSSAKAIFLLILAIFTIISSYFINK